MTVYGYARVSTDGQTLAAQDAQLQRRPEAAAIADVLAWRALSGGMAMRRRAALGSAGGSFQSKQVQTGDPNECFASKRDCW